MAPKKVWGKLIPESRKGVPEINSGVQKKRVARILDTCSKDICPKIFALRLEPRTSSCASRYVSGLGSLLWATFFRLFFLKRVSSGLI